MPAYDSTPTSAQVPVVSPSIPLLVWNAESTLHASPAVPSSQQFCFQRDAHLPNCCSVEVQFSGDPGSFRLDFETADTDEDTAYQEKASLTSGLNASFRARIELTTIVAKFGRLTMKTLTNSVTVTAKVC